MKGSSHETIIEEEIFMSGDGMENDWMYDSRGKTYVTALEAKVKALKVALEKANDAARRGEDARHIINGMIKMGKRCNE